MPVRAGHDLVVRRAAAGPGQGEAVADLDALDRLDAHQRAGQPRVQPAVPVHVRAQTRRQSPDHHLDHAAEGVAVLLGRLDLGDHRRARVAVEAAHRVVVDRVQVVEGAAARPAGAATVPSSTTWLSTVTPNACCRKLLGHPAERDPGGGLPGAGPLQDRPGLVEVVLLHARPGRRARAAAGSAGRCGPDRPAPLRRPGRRPSPSPTWATRCCRSGWRPVRPGSRRAGRRRGWSPRRPRTSSGRRGRNRAGAGPAPRRCRRVVTCTWAGSPSRIATRAGPCDSPAVSHLSMTAVFHARRPLLGRSQRVVSPRSSSLGQGGVTRAA